MDKFDVTIISDVSTQYCDIHSLNLFLEEEVKKNGKTLMLTGGYGLTTNFNSELGTENIGGNIGKRFGKKGAIVKIKSGCGKGLVFKGFNRFKPLKLGEMKAKWNIKDYPALVVHKLGEGKVICFTSDCSPAWGTNAIRDQRFFEMWKKIRDCYLF